MRPYIVITNDDGYDALGIQFLTKVMRTIGDVLVVAPDGPRSGQSNALTVTKPIRVRLSEKEEGFEHYICSGTPTDCLKIAFNELITRKPDLVVSGINHGSNAAINVIYSGTMGAAFEGCENGIPSIGFSITSFNPDVDFSFFEPYIRSISNKILSNGLPSNICLNVNAPAGKLKGTKIVRQCKGQWIKETAKRIDPIGHDYFWLTGMFDNHEPEAEDTDEWALKNGYVSIVPTTIDMTAHHFISSLKEWQF